SKNARAYAVRADIWIQKEEWDKARADYTKAIDLDVQDPAPYFMRAAMWQDRQEPRLAITDLTATLRFEPIGSPHYRDRADCWRLLGELERALADANVAIQFDPDSSYGNYLRAVILRDMGDYQQAIVDFNKATELHEQDRFAPSFEELYLERARLWATCPKAKYRNGQKAVEAAHAACVDSKWDSWFCLDTLAVAYAEVGDFEQAVKWQEKAISLAERDGVETADLTARLKLFRAGKAYRHTPLPSGDKRQSEKLSRTE
ncbi:MAG: tetratricopeptide repeat protein, partial [Planctomycetes bacterium]|nr:tetratricopeptide repeat protein [Planctomycetota bacterium]